MSEIALNVEIQALNTVLAFCSSRKHLATTFPVVRKSAESILKECVHSFVVHRVQTSEPKYRPLELSKVAELKYCSMSAHTFF